MNEKRAELKIKNSCGSAAGECYSCFEGLVGTKQKEGKK